MKFCRKCSKEIDADIFIGRQTLCPFCGAYLHICLNCAFYEPGAYNDCRERQAGRVLDKERANFCDYFRFKEGPHPSGAAPADSRDKLDALFKK